MAVLTVVESPTGIVHVGQVMPSGRITTMCGRVYNADTWSRWTQFEDGRLSGQGRSSIRRMIETPMKCERCL